MFGHEWLTGFGGWGQAFAVLLVLFNVRSAERHAVPAVVAVPAFVLIGCALCLPATVGSVQHVLLDVVLVAWVVLIVAAIYDLIKVSRSPSST
ncbi:hypothetical protein EV193_103512 [Herbihabitans rhizosphaerae]|uniref:Uncharacterized protein n=1 Tax=Herbihabitans rhizosphaerae TaxID=1872711 RepID=A0A4Q7KZP3_9PSEU|nr:hypothetical protein [Herbihabitans rhizosphaerae]RZS41192.1 hypothetical protein EV193_103512 [Herbihabitans rhizosphaerae]